MSLESKLAGLAEMRNEDWTRDLHDLRMRLLACDQLAQRLSAAISAQRMPADLAHQVDALRHAVLCAIRVAYITQLAGTIATGERP